jgi:hypothetical protein
VPGRCPLEEKERRHERRASAVGGLSARPTFKPPAPPRENPRWVKRAPKRARREERAAVWPCLTSGRARLTFNKPCLISGKARLICQRPDIISGDRTASDLEALEGRQAGRGEGRCYLGVACALGSGVGLFSGAAALVLFFSLSFLGLRGLLKRSRRFQKPPSICSRATASLK